MSCQIFCFILSLPLAAQEAVFPHAQEIPLKNTSEHESSLQHDLRGRRSYQLQARTTVARVTCLGGDKLSKPSDEARGAPEQANCTQNWYLAKAPSWQGGREPRLPDWDSCGQRLNKAQSPQHHHFEERPQTGARQELF